MLKSYRTNYYSYLGLKYTALPGEIEDAIEKKRQNISERLDDDDADGTEIRRNLVFLKRIKKVLLNEEERIKYNFQNREEIAETIPLLNTDYKLLSSGEDGIGKVTSENFVYLTPADADRAVLEDLNFERQIHVYNNAKEVVTHTNYTYEELLAMSQMATENDWQDEEKKNKRYQGIIMILPIVCFFYYYKVPAHKCPLRRPRLTWAQKQDIISQTPILIAQKR